MDCQLNGNTQNKLVLLFVFLTVVFQQKAEGHQPEFGVFIHHCWWRQVWLEKWLEKRTKENFYTHLVCLCLLRALFSSHEAPEDDGRLGMLMLKEVRVL